MLDKLTHDNFHAHLNSGFTVHYDEGQTMELILVGVDTIGREPAADEERRWSYSLLFRSSDKDHYLIQKQYPVSHPELGNLMLFLVPLGPGAEGMEYEAVFT